MENLQFINVNESVEDVEFDCGVKSINEYIRDAYYPHILQNAYSYCIMYNNIVLGYYQIMFRNIEVNDFPQEISDYITELNDKKISAVHIRFIAIDRKYQKQKIGTKTLNVIIKRVKDLAEIWPIRVITIDAISELVDWYGKAGFVKMNHNTTGQDGTTEAMYFDCMIHKDQLENYINSRI